MVASREFGRLRAWCHQKLFLVPLLCRGVIHATRNAGRTPTLDITCVVECSDALQCAGVCYRVDAHSADRHVSICALEKAQAHLDQGVHLCLTCPLGPRVLLDVPTQFTV